MSDIYTCIGDANEGEDCLPEIGIGEQRFENVIETKCTTEEGASIESEETIFVRGKKRRIGKNGWSTRKCETHQHIYKYISISLGTRDSRILGELLLGTTVRVSFCILHLGVGNLYKRWFTMCACVSVIIRFVVCKRKWKKKEKKWTMNGRVNNYWRGKEERIWVRMRAKIIRRE